MSEEIWKSIDGYENFYEVSNLGNVRSYKNNKWGRTSKPKILKGLTNINYRFVNLCDNGKKISKPVHRLVAETFIPNPQNLKEVNHIDGNKLNNQVLNLEWVSHVDNMRHASVKNLFGQQKKVRCIETGEIFDSITKAAKNIGTSQGALSAKMINSNGYIKGMHFEYVKEK